MTSLTLDVPLISITSIPHFHFSANYSSHAEMRRSRNEANFTAKSFATEQLL